VKKFLALLLARTMVLALAAGGNNNDNTTPSDKETTGNNESTGSTENTENTENTEGTTGGEETKVMTHEEFDAVAVDGAVVVECYIAAVESWYKDACHIYALAEDGGYYIYGYSCTKEEADELVPGMKIRVSGYKAEWSGEVEIVDATIEKLEGTAPEFTADDVTALVGTDDLAKHMNDLVAFKGLTVVASNDDGAAFLYKWDGSGSQGDDITSMSPTARTPTPSPSMLT